MTAAPHDDPEERAAIQAEPPLRVVPRESPPDEALGKPPLTDVGNAARLVELACGKIRYCHARRKWLVWTGTRWIWDDGQHLYALAKRVIERLYQTAAKCRSESQQRALGKHAIASQKAARINAMIDLARFEPGIAANLSELDTDPWLLNCENGTLNLKTASLQRHNPGDMITKSTGLRYDPLARSDLWDRVLKSACGDDKELIAYLQRAAGYAFTGLSTERVFFLVLGPSGAAKSTFLDALLGACGEYGVSTPCETFLVHTATGGNRGDLVRLQGARVIVGAEIRKGARWDEAIVKTITGGDEIVAAAKYEGEVSFRAACTIFFATNDAPVAREDDDGFWARCRRVLFARIIPADEQIKNLKILLREPQHAAAILAWAVRGCLEWQRSGLGSCEAVERSTAAYRAESDPFGDFLTEEMCLDSDKQIQVGRFREIYENWCRSNGVRVLGRRDLLSRLRRLGVEPGKSGGTRLYRGIGEQNGL